MSTTTTANYGWTIPNDDELVKNGAAAIRTLGNAIDTTAASTFTPGAVKLNKTTFSSVASQSINDVFSSTYSTYLISINASTVSSTYLRFRWRVSGADNTTTNYNYQILSYNSTTLTGSRALSTDLNVIGWNNNNDHGITITAINPFDTEKTYYFSNTTGGADANISAGKFGATTSFTGFSIIPVTGNMSGTVTVWGLRA